MSSLFPPRQALTSKVGKRRGIVSVARRLLFYCSSAKEMVRYDLGTWSSEPTACNKDSSLRRRKENSRLLLRREEVFFEQTGRDTAQLAQK